MPQRKNRQFQRGSRFGLIVASLILASCPQNSGQPAREASLRGGLPLADARGSVQRGSVQHLSPEGEAPLRGWIASGRLADLRWPDFSDYCVHVTNFYAPAGYALACVRDGRATPQAVAITEVLAQANSKGLEAEDYNASRWPDWMARVQRSKPVLQRLRSGQLAIRQRPGPKNSLGLAKFLFPNEYNVYLHGTPATELFEKSRRDFSHGCIRVQDPAGLAVWVLPDKPEWTRDRIVSAMNGDHPLQVNLDRPIPVLIVYGTAVVLENGEAHFFEDIYGYDAELEAVLAKGYPYPG